MDPYDDKTLDNEDIPSFETSPPLCDVCTKRESDSFCEECMKSMCNMCDCGVDVHMKYEWMNDTHRLSQSQSPVEQQQQQQQQPLRTPSNTSLASAVNMLEIDGNVSTAPSTPRSEHSFTVENSLVHNDESVSKSSSKRSIVGSGTSVIVPSSCGNVISDGDALKQQQQQQSSVRASGSVRSFASSRHSSIGRRVTRTSTSSMNEQRIQDMIKVAVEERVCQALSAQQATNNGDANSVDVAEKTERIQSQLQAKWDDLRNMINDRIDKLESTLTADDNVKDVLVPPTQSESSSSSTTRATTRRSSSRTKKRSSTSKRSSKKKSRNNKKSQQVTVTNIAMDVPESAPPLEQQPPKQKEQEQTPKYGRMPPRYLQRRLTPAERAIAVRMKEQQYLAKLAERMKEQRSALAKVASVPPRKNNKHSVKRKNRRRHVVKVVVPNAARPRPRKSSTELVAQVTDDSRRVNSSTRTKKKVSAASSNKLPSVVNHTPRTQVQSGKPSNAPPTSIAVKRPHVVVKKKKKTNLHRPRTAYAVSSRHGHKNRTALPESYLSKDTFQRFLDDRLAQVSLLHNTHASA